MNTIHRRRVGTATLLTVTAPGGEQVRYMLPQGYLVARRLAGRLSEQEAWRPLPPRWLPISWIIHPFGG
jgi:hypothetical protein